MQLLALQDSVLVCVNCRQELIYITLTFRLPTFLDLISLLKQGLDLINIQCTILIIIVLFDDYVRHFLYNDLLLLLSCRVILHLRDLILQPDREAPKQFFFVFEGIGKSFCGGG